MVHLPLPATLGEIVLELRVSLQLQVVDSRQRRNQFALAGKRGIPKFDQPEVGPRPPPNAKNLVQDLDRREVRSDPCEDQGHCGGRPRNAHMTVHEQVRLRRGISHEGTRKPEDVVDMATLWCQQVLTVFKNVVKAQLEPPVRAKGRTTRPFRDARIKIQKHMAHASRGMAIELSDAADGDLEGNKSIRRIHHGQRFFIQGIASPGEERVSFPSGRGTNEAFAGKEQPS